jgi:hypothetical protein
LSLASSAEGQTPPPSGRICAKLRPIPNELVRLRQAGPSLRELSVGGVLGAMRSMADSRLRKAADNFARRHLRFCPVPAAPDRRNSFHAAYRFEPRATSPWSETAAMGRSRPPGLRPLDMRVPLAGYRPDHRAGSSWPAAVMRAGTDGPARCSNATGCWHGTVSRSFSRSAIPDLCEIVGITAAWDFTPSRARDLSPPPLTVVREIP